MSQKVLVLIPDWNVKLTISPNCATMGNLPFTIIHIVFDQIVWLNGTHGTVTLSFFASSIIKPYAE